MTRRNFNDSLASRKPQAGWRRYAEALRRYRAEKTRERLAELLQALLTELRARRAA